MTPTIEKRVLRLVATLQNDSNSIDDDSARFEAYNSGEFIYGVRIDNCLDGSTKVSIHVQWPRLHRWIVGAQQESKELVWDHSATCPENVHVHVGVAGSIISYTAILERSVLVEMLKEHEHYLPMPADTSAETLWKMVRKYECL